MIVWMYEVKTIPKNHDLENDIETLIKHDFKKIFNTGVGRLYDGYPLEDYLLGNHSLPRRLVYDKDKKLIGIKKDSDFSNFKFNAVSTMLSKAIDWLNNFMNYRIVELNKSSIQGYL